MQTEGFRAYWEAAPSYTLIREPLRRLCHQLIAFTIFGKGQAPKKVTTTDIFFLRSIDEGTMVITEQSLQNLTVEVRHISTIDPDELIRLRICERLLNTAPLMPQATAAAPRTIAQRLHRVEEEVPASDVRGDDEIVNDMHLEFETHRVRQRTDGAGTLAQ
ncbi:hypothetical protein Tco_1225986 [Tanacetum coccineum]